MSKDLASQLSDESYANLAETPDGCAARYRRFCQCYQIKKKQGGRRYAWGRQALATGCQDTGEAGQEEGPPPEGGGPTAVAVWLREQRFTCQIDRRLQQVDLQRILAHRGQPSHQACLR